MADYTFLLYFVDIDDDLSSDSPPLSSNAQPGPSTLATAGRSSPQRLDLPSSPFRDSDIEEFFDIDGASAPADRLARDQSGSLTDELLQTVGHPATLSPSPGPLPSNVTVLPTAADASHHMAGSGSSPPALSNRLPHTSDAVNRTSVDDVEEGRLRQSKCANFDQMTLD